MSLPVAILCGGLGKRLGSLTKSRPKSMVEVAGKPFLEHQVALLRKNGYTDIVLCTGHYGDRFRGFISGALISHENHELGTGGAVKRALPLLGKEFLVIYGDSYLDCDYRCIERVFMTSGRLGLKTVFDEVDYGLSAFRDLAFRGFDGRFSLNEVHHALWNRNQLVEYWMRKRFLEIGTPDGLERTNLHLKYGSYLQETSEILENLHLPSLDSMVNMLSELKGRLFILGVGGSAANASHAVNDFRKILGIEAYAPTDNVAELSARINDVGWASCYIEWLKVSRLSHQDMIMVLSVGGGRSDISQNIANAVLYAKEEIGCRIIGIVGRDGGYTARHADACLLIPTVNSDRVTPHVESLQAVICHLMVWMLRKQ